MKKHGQQHRYKQQNGRHALRQFVKKLRHKYWLKAKRWNLIKVAKHDRSDYLRMLETEKAVSGHERIIAPLNFSFLKNATEVIKFLAHLRMCFDEKKPVKLFLKDVQEIDNDGIVVLISILTRFKANGIGFSVRRPNDRKVRDKLNKAHFFECLDTRLKDVSKYQFGQDNNIYTIADREVVTDVTLSLILDAAETIWGEPKRCPGVQTVFVELMHNTIAHALGGGTKHEDIEKRKHWWCTVDKTQENKVCFSFVDYGIGVFNSLKNKPKSSKWFSFPNIVESLRYSSNADTFRDILNGKIHRTVTGEYFRGKGLPGIYENYERGIIKNLHIITNDVFFDAKNDNFIKLDNHFEGTFVYWEIDDSTPSFN